MPAPPQGLAFYNGVKQVVSCSYTLSHGITPGTASIEIAPQDNFPDPVGPLTFQFGPVTFTFPDMALNVHSIRRNAQGKIWTLSLFDRRWKWNAGTGAGGPLSGSYNVRQDDDTLDPARKRTPQQLAVICLQAMGEGGFDVSQMPNNTYPAVIWEDDNPAQALATLAEQEGCRVVLRLDGSVQVAKTGVGLQLPQGPGMPIMENTLSINPPQRPDALMVACGRSRYQVDFPLEAVGLDTDGKIKPINQLSYKPKGGWAREMPPYMYNVSFIPAKNGLVPRDLAQQTVFRWYRIALGPVTDKGSGVAQVDTVTITGGDFATTYAINIGDQKVSVIGNTLDVNQIAATLAAALSASTIPEFVAIAWTVAGATITGTGQPGVAFTATSSVMGGSGTIGQVKVVTQAGPGSGITIPGFGKVSTLRQILPIEDEMVATFIDFASNPAAGATSARNVKAQVMGIFWDGVETYQNTVNNGGPNFGSFYNRPFTVDRGLGVVKFANAVFRYGKADADGLTILPAQLYLRTAVSVRSPSTWAWQRYHRALVYPGGQWSTGARILKHDEIVYQSIPTYSYLAFPQPQFVRRVDSNEALVKAEADYYLAAADLEYQTPLPQEITYAGLLPISPDGAVQQVTWQVSTYVGATTRASLNNEFDPRTPPYRERRLFEEIRGGIIQNVKQLAGRLSQPDFNKVLPTIPGAF